MPSSMPESAGQFPRPPMPSFSWGTADTARRVLQKSHQSAEGAQSGPQQTENEGERDARQLATEVLLMEQELKKFGDQLTAAGQWLLELAIELRAERADAKRSASNDPQGK